MAKKLKKRSRARNQGRFSWPLAIGIAGVGLVGFAALLYLAVQEPAAPPSLVEYCEANPSSCSVAGSDEAPVTVVEVADFGCPACRAFHEETAAPIFEQYVDSGVVRWIFLPYALHAETTAAAASALCAAEQAPYFDYATELFDSSETPDALTRAHVLRVGEALGLDSEAFAECVDANRYGATIGSNIEAATRARVTSTPTFFVNGRKVQGALSLPAFQQQIELELQ